MKLLVIFGLIVAFTFVDLKKNDEKSSKIMKLGNAHAYPLNYF